MHDRLKIFLFVNNIWFNLWLTVALGGSRIGHNYLGSKTAKVTSLSPGRGNLAKK